MSTACVGFGFCKHSATTRGAHGLRQTYRQRHHTYSLLPSSPRPKGMGFLLHSLFDVWGCVLPSLALRRGACPCQVMEKANVGCRDRRPASPVPSHRQASGRGFSGAKLPLSREELSGHRGLARVPSRAAEQQPGRTLPTPGKTAQTSQTRHRSSSRSKGAEGPGSPRCGDGCAGPTLCTALGRVHSDMP